ncbi:MAG: response regulator transcription factor [Lachnospiraceae bacterium]
MKKTILVVEDDNKLNSGVCLALKNENYVFIQCKTLKEAKTVIQEKTLSLILLDVNLPDGNGIDFIKQIRLTSSAPIILMTINNMEVDIVTGLESGANDYITKPFSLMVLRARVAVQLRASENEISTRFQQDEFDFDFEKMEFICGGNVVELSKTEQKILRILCDNKGATVKRSYLIDEVWQGESEFVDEHALTVAIKRLRDKLEEDASNPEYIKTVYRVGYAWVVKR